MRKKALTIGKKKHFNNFQCVCRTVFHEIAVEKLIKDNFFWETLHCREMFAFVLVGNGVDN